MTSTALNNRLKLKTKKITKLKSDKTKVSPPLALEIEKLIKNSIVDNAITSY